MRGVLIVIWYFEEHLKSEIFNMLDSLDLKSRRVWGPPRTNAQAAWKMWPVANQKARWRKHTGEFKTHRKQNNCCGAPESTIDTADVSLFCFLSVKKCPQTTTIPSSSSAMFILNSRLSLRGFASSPTNVRGQTFPMWCVVPHNVGPKLFYI